MAEFRDQDDNEAGDSIDRDEERELRLQNTQKSGKQKNNLC